MCALLLGSVSIRYWNHSLDSSPSDVSDLVPAEQYHPTLPPNITQHQGFSMEHMSLVSKIPSGMRLLR
jgi:hypothetical protein